MKISFSLAKVTLKLDRAGMLIDYKNDAELKVPLKPLFRSSGKIGSDIRALRRSRNWTLNNLAEQLNRSVGWLSQIERDVSEPALDDIRNIAALFSLPVSFFFSNGTDSDEAAYIVRSGTRRVMTDAPKGLAESLLSPDLGGAFEIIHSVFAPGAACPEPFVRPTEEAGYVLEGRLVLFIDGVRFELNQGDSFRFAGEQIMWVNEGAVNAVLIWVIAPPVY
ncbi:MAG: helix-turn-helix domain-containing protein [Candidatus Puniceispirillaceae bacterium]